MPAEQFVSELNEQIGREYGAHQQYVAVAVHYDALTFPQLAASSTARRSRSAATR